MEVFCKKIGELEKQIMEKVTSCLDMEISSEEQEQFDNATVCYLCKKEIFPLKTFCLRLNFWLLHTSRMSW